MSGLLPMDYPCCTTDIHPVASRPPRQPRHRGAARAVGRAAYPRHRHSVSYRPAAPLSLTNILPNASRVLPIATCIGLSRILPRRNPRRRVAQASNSLSGRTPPSRPARSRRPLSPRPGHSRTARQLWSSKEPCHDGAPQRRANLSGGRNILTPGATSLGGASAHTFQSWSSCFPRPRTHRTSHAGRDGNVHPLGLRVPTMFHEGVCLPRRGPRYGQVPAP